MVDHLPTWTVSLLIILWFHLRPIGAASLQRHPKFPAANQMEFFSGSRGRAATPLALDWLPHRQTVLYMIQHNTPLNKYTERHLTLRVANLPKGEDFNIRMKWRCQPNGPNSSHDFSPLDIKAIKTEITLCKQESSHKSILPLAIMLLSSEWTDPFTYRMILPICMPSETEVQFTDTLTFYFKIQFEFIGKHWRLESNGLYLRNWDSLVRFRGDEIKDAEQPVDGLWLDSNAFDMIKQTNIRFPDFHTIRFIHKDVAERIQSAPEFVQATIGLGVFLSLIRPNCRVYRSGDPNLGSHDMDIGIETGMQFNRLNVSSGLITFSPNGISEMMHTYVKPGREPTAFSSGDLICRQLRLRMERISGIYNGPDEASQLPGGPIYLKSNFEYWKGFNSKKKGCHILEPGAYQTVTLFLRDSDSVLLCPIICSSASHNYEFHRGRKRLYPIYNGQSFTQVPDTGISISKNSLAIRFLTTATDRDEGEYTCSAGGLSATINAKFVSLPVFRILEAIDWPDGSLPDSIFAPIGGSYTAKCTAYFFGMKKVTIAPEFYVVEDRTTGKWVKLTFDQFKQRLEFHDCSAQLEAPVYTSHSVTLTLTVRKIPKDTPAFDFSHRYVCRATVSEDDIRRYGVPEYFVETATDVILSQPFTRTVISNSMSPCCINRCLGENCELIFQLDPDYLADLKAQGLNISANFTGGTGGDWGKWTKFNQADGTLSITPGHSLYNMTDDEKAQYEKIKDLIPTFTLNQNQGNGGSNVLITDELGSCPPGAKNCIASIAAGTVPTGSIPKLPNLSIDTTPATVTVTDSATTKRQRSTRPPRATHSGNINYTELNAKASQLLQEIERAASSCVANLASTGYLLVFLCAGVAGLQFWLP